MYHYGGGADHRGLRSRKRLQTGLSERTDRTVREREGCGPVHGTDPGDDRAEEGAFSVTFEKGRQYGQRGTEGIWH